MLHPVTIHAYPGNLEPDDFAQTLGIPFELTPEGSPPIILRFPPHSRATASAPNIKTTYTKIGSGDSIFSHSHRPAPQTLHNERVGKAVVPKVQMEKNAASEVPLVQDTVRFPFHITVMQLVYPHLERWNGNARCS